MIYSWIQNTPGPKQSGKAESSEESPMDTDEKQTEGEVIQDDADSNMDTSQEPDSSSQEKVEKVFISVCLVLLIPITEGSPCIANCISSQYVLSTSFKLID